MCCNITGLSNHSSLSCLGSFQVTSSWRRKGREREREREKLEGPLLLQNNVWSSRNVSVWRGNGLIRLSALWELEGFCAILRKEGVSPLRKIWYYHWNQNLQNTVRDMASCWFFCKNSLPGSPCPTPDLLVQGGFNYFFIYGMHNAHERKILTYMTCECFLEGQIAPGVMKGHRGPVQLIPKIAVSCLRRAELK